jgi:hypothetical protein
MHFIAGFTIVGFAFNFVSHKAFIPIKLKTLGFARFASNGHVTFFMVPSR